MVRKSTRPTAACPGLEFSAPNLMPLHVLPPTPLFRKTRPLSITQLIARLEGSSADYSITHCGADLSSLPSLTPKLSRAADKAPITTPDNSCYSFPPTPGQCHRSGGFAESTDQHEHVHKTNPTIKKGENTQIECHKKSDQSYSPSRHQPLHLPVRGAA